MGLCQTPQVEIDDTVLIKYLDTIGFEKVLRIKSFVKVSHNSSLIHSNMFTVNMDVSNNVLFFKIVNGQELTRHEISDTSLNNEGHHIVFLNNESENSTSYIKNNNVYYFSLREVYENNNLVGGYGSGTFMISKGIYDSYKLNQIIYEGVELFNEVECYNYKLINENITMDLYFDKASCLFIGCHIEKESSSSFNKVLIKKVFENYNSYDGILVPMKVTIYKNGEFWYSVNTKDVKFNIDLNETLFYDALERNKYSIYF